MTKYNNIGKDYDSTRLADDYILERIMTFMGQPKNGLYMDIGCGTGNYASKLGEKGFRVLGVDPSELMLSIAQEKYPAIEWRMAKAEDTALEPKSIQGILATLTIHHWERLDLAFQEMDRILMESGQMIIFTSTPQQMEGYWLNHYFPKMMQKSIAQMPSLETVGNAISKTNLKIAQIEPYAIHPNLKDHFLYCGKHRPELYLEPRIRKGISSFADLANREEVEKGLEQLENDISSGKIHSIISSYDHGHGDYMFLNLTKGNRLEQIPKR